ncbi:hypothetical protein ACROYT_G007493 [Oculina patagonica]
MFPRKHEHFLLLFGCLFQICFLYGISHASASEEKSTKVPNVDEIKNYMTVRNNQRRQNHEIHADKSSGRKHNTFKGMKKSVVRKLSWNKIVHTGFHNGRLKQQLGKRQMIAPGYYQAECSEKKPCKEGMYCNVLYCEKCHKLNVACNGKDQCCKGLVCAYGRCEKKSKGDPVFLEATRCV